VEAISQFPRFAIWPIISSVNHNEYSTTTKLPVDSKPNTLTVLREHEQESFSLINASFAFQEENIVAVRCVIHLWKIWTGPTHLSSRAKKSNKSI